MKEFEVEYGAPPVTAPKYLPQWRVANKDGIVAYCCDRKDAEMIAKALNRRTRRQAMILRREQ